MRRDRSPQHLDHVLQQVLFHREGVPRDVDHGTITYEKMKEKSGVSQGLRSVYNAQPPAAREARSLGVGRTDRIVSFISRPAETLWETFGKRSRRSN